MAFVTLVAMLPAPVKAIERPECILDPLDTSYLTLKGSKLLALEDPPHTLELSCGPPACEDDCPPTCDASDLLDPDAGWSDCSIPRCDANGAQCVDYLCSDLQLCDACPPPIYETDPIAVCGVPVSDDAPLPVPDGVGASVGLACAATWGNQNVLPKLFIRVTCNINCFPAPGASAAATFSAFAAIGVQADPGCQGIAFGPFPPFIEGCQGPGSHIFCLIPVVTGGGESVDCQGEAIGLMYAGCVTKPAPEPWFWDR